MNTSLSAFLLRHRIPMLVLCVALAAGIAAFPLHRAQSSHEDPTVLADADGALDDDAHVEGIYLAMKEEWVAAWMMMTEQFVSVMMQQMLILATFMDAKQQLEVQQTFQELTAQAHKDYHPSFQMCQFGTTVKSLAQANQIADENTRQFDAMMEKREHLHAKLGSSGGISSDVTMRMIQFKKTYCDASENDKMVALMCKNSEGPVERRTKDIDYPRVIDGQYTLNLNFRDSDNTDEEKDVIALGDNLYGSTVIDFMPEQLMNEVAGQGLFMETRSVHAIRSVARRSFTTIVGMKAEGDQDQIYQVRPYLYGIIKELGVPDTEIQKFLGENPSYFAQMEVLTHKIYESPEFFTNLYDKPANVMRAGVALQAIELMQDRDRFEGALRREMLISLILELKLRRYQEDMYSVLYSTTKRKFGPNDL